MKFDPIKHLEQLLNSNESEIVEFKQAKQNFDFDKLGQYFSALSNEANLNECNSAWLVFGIDDNKNILGTQYKNNGGLQDLKADIANHTTNRITFTAIYDINYQEQRIIVLQIPAAPRGIPIAWYGHYYGRDHSSLQALNLEELEKIRGQTLHKDWSAQICSEASILDLDSDAIALARINFKNKNTKLAKEVDLWDDQTFLNKAKITVNSKVTNTALLLLGREEASHFLLPAIAQISWILKDKDNLELDYQHFHIPFIINAEKAAQKIRNLTYRYLPDNTLFPTEVTQYEPYVIREALYNCIAHQDYALQRRINLVESPEWLIFENGGDFLPLSINNVIEQDAPQSFYRNKFLCDAMVALNMIDTIGSGIKKMFNYQRQRFFPLPDYEFLASKGVKVKLFGKILDKNYTQLLINKPGLSMHIVILLDQVQKNRLITSSDVKGLKNLKLIEGRKPNYFVAAHIAEASGEKEKYIKNKAFDDEHYKKMIMAFIIKYGSATRQEIESLLMDKLSNVLNQSKKKNKVTNLLSILRDEELIVNVGSRTKSSWIRNIKEI